MSDNPTCDCTGICGDDPGIYSSDPLRKVQPCSQWIEQRERANNAGLARQILTNLGFTEKELYSNGALVSALTELQFLRKKKKVKIIKVVPSLEITNL